MHRWLSLILIPGILLFYGCNESGTKNQPSDDQNQNAPANNNNGSDNGEDNSSANDNKGNNSENNNANGSAAAGAAKKITLTPKNTEIDFVGSKPGTDHTGNFNDFNGLIEWAADPSKSKISVEIDTASLKADVPKLTQHLKSPDFFNVNKYPKATFVSTKIVEDKGKGKTHAVTGDLTLIGKTVTISFPVEVSTKEGNFMLQSAFTINRQDFGMDYGGGKIKDDVKISVSVTSGG